MAPNQMHLTLVTTELSPTEVGVEFLPLTHKGGNGVHPDHVAELPQIPENYWDWKAPSEDYWVWPTKEQPESIFSAAHIEANLIRDARRREAEKEQKEAEADSCNDDSDSYWDWSCCPHPNVLTSNYMEMRMLQGGYLEDGTMMIRETPCGETDLYWDTTTAKDKDAATVRSPRPAGSYWDWPATRDAKIALMASLLTETQINELLSAQHTEAMLRATASDMYWSESRVLDQQDTDYYWQWSHEPATTLIEPLPENYWVWEAN